MSREEGLACIPISAPWLSAFLEVAYVYVSYCLLRSGRCVGHHAPRIRLGDLYAFIALSLQSHRHLRISIIDSIVGEFAAVLRTCSFVIRFSATSHIAHPHILRRQPG
jgi:hypothetical protein